MIAYLDSSVLLRVALAQPDALDPWRDVERGVTSELARAARASGFPVIGG